MIAAYLLQPGSSGSYGLTTLARQHLGYHMTELEDIAEKDADGNLDLKHIEINKLSDYACEDADITFRLYAIFREKLEKDGCLSLLENIEIPLASILAHMELKGVYADISILERMSAKTEKELARITEEIYNIAEEKFNIHSPKQLSEILFDKLNLPPQKKTKTGFSTDESVLQRLSSMHILPARILEVRHLAKLKNTYIDVLPGMVHPKTGRIHPEFNQVVTATGRLSSSNPNLQNIPVRREPGKPIREAFMAEKEGYVLLAADYSQIELRMLAHFSGDTNLVKSFMEGRDIHAVTASLLHSVPVEDITDRMRYEAKAVNFGIIYGQGPYGLARVTNISHKEARTFIETYFEKFPGIRSFIDTTVEQARKCGEVRTILNRRRLIPEMQSPNKNTQRSAERIAVNTVIQGSAADLIKKAMVDIQKDLTKFNSEAFFILQIHDELIFELPEHEIERVTRIVRTNMVNAITLSVPLTVHLEHGKTWKETK
jgi:DNA polymerase-1